MPAALLASERKPALRRGRRRRPATTGHRPGDVRGPPAARAECQKDTLRSQRVGALLRGPVRLIRRLSAEHAEDVRTAPLRRTVLRGCHGRSRVTIATAGSRRTDRPAARRGGAWRPLRPSRRVEPRPCREQPDQRVPQARQIAKVGQWIKSMALAGWRSTCKSSFFVGIRALDVPHRDEDGRLAARRLVAGVPREHARHAPVHAADQPRGARLHCPRRRWHVSTRGGRRRAGAGTSCFVAASSCLPSPRACPRTSRTYAGTT